MDLKLFNAYQLRARFSVGALYALPFLADFAAVRGLKFETLPAMLLCILLVVLCQAALPLLRRPDKKTPIPNTARDLLMPSGQLPALTRARYYRKLSALEPEFAPFATLTADTPQAQAEALCESAVAYLRGRTRESSRFPLLAEENISYGFTRNGLALKWPFVALNAIGAYVMPNCFCVPQMALVHVIFIALVCVLFTKESLHKAGKRYAYALLETVDTLS